MGILVIVLRALHILGGVFWAGSAMTLYGFVMPSAAATRPESGRFMQHLAATSGLSNWMTISSIAAVVGGLALFAPISGQFDHDWMRSTRGIVLSIGALLGVGAFAEGQAISAPAGRRLGAIARAIAASGGTPTVDQAKEIGALQAKLTKTGTRGAWMLAVAATLMAVARYL